ncbi:MAG: phosphate acyltransferase [Pseudomonadota bacterium]|nr:phosphate acyltransferase [Pseudomonadota bacterium]
MIRTLNDFERMAGEKGPKKMAVLVPEDEEFMLAVKKSWEKGYIEPVLIGNEERIAAAARKVAFDLTPFAKIAGDDLQGISDLGIKMLFEGAAPIAGKGQIPTSYIYRSIIRAEARAASGMTVSVVTFWDIPGGDHLVAFTDTGVNIDPDLKAKREIVKNAVFAYRLLGFPRPRIAVLSGQRELGGKLGSHEDYEALRDEAAAGEFGSCEIVAATSFTEIFLGGRRAPMDYGRVREAELPHILLVPCLDTGNILCKLDFFLDVNRSSLVATSRGPVCIPARSDFSDNIVQQIAMCVVLADRMGKEVE